MGHVGENRASGAKSVCLVVTAEVTAVTFYKGYVRFLRDHGWTVSVIARSEGRLEEWAAEEGAIAYSVDLAREPSPIRDAKALMQIVSILRRIRPDAVVSATPKAGLLGTIASRLARVPVRVYQIWGLYVSPLGSKGVPGPPSPSAQHREGPLVLRLE